MSSDPADPAAKPPSLAAFERTLETDRDLWVFAYGSLMWDPGFVYAEHCPALLRGYHRSFCIASVRHRGTAERPGLVFGLDHGGSCRGVAFRVAAPAIAEVLAQLWQREMVSHVYRPKRLPVRLSSGTVVAIAFVVDRSHPQYCGRLDLEEAATRICQGVGGRGRNLDYLSKTVEHLRQLGIADHGLEALLRQVMSCCG
ncbi:MAG: gamma-glutamylcyclotransferase [Azospirillum sp.]|nr:gamma-glutamylcyclotransferase [Azospirillum sp.]